jgi:DNA-binding LacI/PurR family transcriptional regulator
LPTPRTDELLGRLRDEIISHFKPGDAFFSEREIADRFSANRKTVRRAVAELVQEGWLSEPGPRRARRVSYPRRRPIHTTGFYFPFTATSLLFRGFGAGIFSAIYQIATQLDRHVLNLFGLARGLDSFSPALFWSPTMRSLDSLIALEVFDGDLLQQAARFYPVVCLDAECRLPGVSSCWFDHELAGKMAVKYLYDLGHRRIAFLGRDSTTSKDPAVAARANSFREMIQFLPGAVGEELYVEGAKDAESRVGRLLSMSRKDRPTAIFAVDHQWDVACLLVRAGLRLGRDISLITTGPITCWADYLTAKWEETPPSQLPHWLREFSRPYPNQPTDLAVVQLATVALPVRAMGHWGMRAIARRLETPGSEPHHHVLRAVLERGNTTAPPPSR